MHEILASHMAIARDVNQKIKPLQHFKDYLHHGYYPFFQEVPELYFHRIEEVLNLIIEIELPLLRKVEVAYVAKLKSCCKLYQNQCRLCPM